MRRLALLALLAACSGRGPQQVGSQPSWRARAAPAPGAADAPVAGPVTFAPSTQPAARYNEPVTAPPPSPLADATIAAVRDAAVAASTRVPIADARLFRACAELAEVVPEEGVISYALVEFALQRNGIIEPSPHLLVVWGDVSSPQVIVEQLAPRIPELLADGATARLGIGVSRRSADGTGAVVFALQGSGVSTRPIPRAVRAGGSFLIDATIDAQYRDPEVFVTRASGSTERVELGPASRPGRAGAFTAEIRCGAGHGRQQVEITASDAHGSTVLANFPVWCGADPPSSVTVDPSRDALPLTDAADAEKQLLAMLNRDRLAAGLPSLVWDDRVAAVARAHSDEMRRTRIVAHISPTTGSAADRVRAAQIKTAVVLENVARAYGLGEAHQGLMNSPGHRANMMSTAATHVGIGVVLGEEISGRREIFITQVFTRVPPRLDPDRALDVLREKITQLRPVEVNAELTAIAQRLARELAAGKTREQAYPLVRPQLDRLGARYLRLASVITAAADLAAVDGASILGTSHPDDVGIGVAQGTHPEIGDGAIWVVVLLAERRAPR